jgi:oxygen-independent coproporphyrinogen-3 oxidase
VGRTGGAFPEKAYLDGLIAELAMYSDKAEWNGRSIASIFIGGGTPSLFSAESIESLLSEIEKRFRFAPAIEITLEANPGTVQEELGREKLCGFRAAGVNRLSFGVQSFSENKLRFLGRIHSAGDAASAVGNARAAGFSNINVDLIFGVLDETVEHWNNELSQALALHTEHLSAYALTIEPGTEFGRSARRGKTLVTEDEAGAAMFSLTYERLAEVGILPYEISNFALPGSECQHNLGYWFGSDYLGLGAGAHSFRACKIPENSAATVHGYRWSNVPGPELYIRRALDSGDASQLREEISPEKARIEFFFLGLRTSRGVSNEQYQQRFTERLDQRYNHVIKDLSTQGLLESTAEQIRLSPRGRLFSDSVFSAFAEASI